jgi:pyridoxal 5'-phosphate synthase pdxT subunit
MKTVGILAFQGNVIEHAAIIGDLGQRSKEVRSVKDLEDCDRLIIPGGESTTIGFFLENSGLMEELRKRAKKGFPIFGTCAGTIILAKNIIGDSVPPHLGLMDITVRRNAYGKQIDSFHADLNIPSLKLSDLHAAFIRAPIIEKVGPEVKVLAKYKNNIVLVRQNNLLAATFHPELRGDTRLHKYFIQMTL